MFVHSLVLTALLAPLQQEPPARNVPDRGVVTTNQRTTPAGSQSVFKGRVYGVAFGPRRIRSGW